MTRIHYYFNTIIYILTLAHGLCHNLLLVDNICIRKYEQYILTKVSFLKSYDLQRLKYEQYKYNEILTHKT